MNIFNVEAQTGYTTGAWGNVIKLMPQSQEENRKRRVRSGRGRTLSVEKAGERSGWGNPLKKGYTKRRDYATL